jgi:hypothetical protein
MCNNSIIRRAAKPGGIGLKMAEYIFTPEVPDVKISFCLDVISGNTKLEDRLVRQIFYTMISTKMMTWGEIRRNERSRTE